MRIAMIAVLFVVGTQAGADYSTHDGVTLFTKQPCKDVIAAIDNPENTLAALAAMGMAWGFLLGYDTARGGLEGNEESTLIRLRRACAESPGKTAIEILEGFPDR